MAEAAAAVVRGRRAEVGGGVGSGGDAEWGSRLRGGSGEGQPGEGVQQKVGAMVGVGDWETRRGDRSDDATEPQGSARGRLGRRVVLPWFQLRSEASRNRLFCKISKV